MWRSKGYDSIDGDEDQPILKKIVGGKPFRSLIVVLLLLGSALTAIIVYFFRTPANMADVQDSGNVVYLSLSANQYLTASCTGEVFLTATPWLNGSRFELIPTRGGEYHVRSLAANEFLSLDSSDNLLKAQRTGDRSYVSLRRGPTPVSTRVYRTYQLTSDLAVRDVHLAHAPHSPDSTRLTLHSERPRGGVYGVNIGGWFIPERWMQPTFFEGVDPYNSQLCGLVAVQGRAEAERRMLAHLESWFTAQDLDRLQQLGVQHLRVPVGFWNLVESPYPIFVPINVSTSLHYLDWVVAEAGRRNMTVLLDFHGAPGSQNGWDHSGCGYNSQNGAIWRTDANRVLSLQAIEVMAERYGSLPQVLGIELLNEPHADLEQQYHAYLRQFYQDGYKAVRRHSARVLVVLCVLWEDYFSAWDEELIEPEFFNVAFDWHSYGFDNLSPSQQAAKLQQYNQLLRRHTHQHPVIVGEWSVFFHPARLEDQSPVPSTAFLAAQLDAYGDAWGWYFWNFKVEPAPEQEKGLTGWSFLQMSDMGYDFGLPRPPPVPAPSSGHKGSSSP